MSWYKRLVTFVLLSLALTGAAPGQQFSAQQLAYLMETFLQSLTSSVPGTVIIVGSLPADRLTGVIPSSQVASLPGALSDIASNASDIAVNTADIASLSSASSAGFAALVIRIDAIEARTSLWMQASADASDWMSSFSKTNPAKFTGAITNISSSGTGWTNITTFNRGEVTGNTYTGP